MQGQKPGHLDASLELLVMHGGRIHSHGEVRVERTRVDSFSFMDSLNFFGSNLGLWPGLGLYQMVEWLGGIVLATKIISVIRQYCRATSRC